MCVCVTHTHTCICIYCISQSVNLGYIVTSYEKSEQAFWPALMTNLGSIFKSRDITLPTKVHLVKAMVFSVVMYGCESWTVKKAEHQRIDAFELWCWRRC